MLLHKASANLIEFVFYSSNIIFDLIAILESIGTNDLQLEFVLRQSDH